MPLNLEDDIGILGEKKSKIALEDDLGILEKKPEGIVSNIISTGEALVKGAASGVKRRLPEMIGGAGEFIGIPGAKELKASAREGEVAEYTGTKKAFYEAGEMLPASIAPAAATYGVGKAISLIPHPVAKVAGIALQAAGPLLTAGLFGTSQAQQTLDTAEIQAKKLEDTGDVAGAAKVRSDAGTGALLTGSIEAAGEYLGTKYLGKMLKLTGAEPITVKSLLKTLGVEIGTEIGQQFGEATVEKKMGIRPEAEPLEEAKGVIAPTAIMTLLTGGVGKAMESVGKPKEKTKEKGFGISKFTDPLVSEAGAIGEAIGEQPPTRSPAMEIKDAFDIDSYPVSFPLPDTELPGGLTIPPVKKGFGVRTAEKTPLEKTIEEEQIKMKEAQAKGLTREQQLEKTQVNAIKTEEAADLLLNGKSIETHIKEGMESGLKPEVINNNIRELLNIQYAKEPDALKQLQYLKAEKQLNKDVSNAFEKHITVEEPQKVEGMPQADLNKTIADFNGEWADSQTVFDDRYSASLKKVKELEKKKKALKGRGVKDLKAEIDKQIQEIKKPVEEALAARQEQEEVFAEDFRNKLDEAIKAKGITDEDEIQGIADDITEAMSNTRLLEGYGVEWSKVTPLSLLDDMVKGREVEEAVSDEQTIENLKTNIKQLESAGQTPEVTKLLEETRTRLKERSELVNSVVETVKEDLKRAPGKMPSKPVKPTPVKTEPVQNPDHIDFITSRIEAGQAGKKQQDASGKWHGVASTFPAWFQNKGYVKKDILGLINKLKDGKTLTNKQQDRIGDLVNSSQKEFEKFKEGEKTATEEKEELQTKEKGEIKLDPLTLSEGDKVIKNGVEFTHRGMDDEGNVRLVNDKDIRLDAFDVIYVDKVIKKEFLKPEEQKPEPKKKPAPQELPLGAEKEALKGPLPSEPTPETPLEKAQKEAETRKTVAEEKKAQEKLPIEKSIETKPSTNVATFVSDKLSKGEKIAKKDLIKQADEAFGGTRAAGKYTSKDMFDALEMGVNQYLAEEGKRFDPNVSARDAKLIVEGLREQTLGLIPSQLGLRSEEQDEFQQFSTPPDLAYVMNWVAKVSKSDTALEPSAGIGGIATFAKIAGAKTIVNELSERRAGLLKEMGFDRVFTENAEQLDNILPDDVKPTVIVMNPPFSSTAGRMKGKTSSTNLIMHLNQAVARVEDGGRLVALIPLGRFVEPKVLRDWFKGVQKENNLRAIIEISGKGYAKYGTTYNNRIIVLDKTSPQGENIVKGRVEDVKDAIPLLEGIRNDRAEVSKESGILKQTPVAESGVAEEVEGSEGKSLPAEPVSPATGELGAGTGTTAGEAVKGSDRGRADRAERVGASKGAELSVSGRKQKSGVSKGKPGTGGNEPAAADSGQTEGRPEVEELSSGLIIEAKEEETSKELSDSLFEAYSPQRLEIPGSKPHPGKLVQSAALAAVKPPKPTYTPNLPKEVITGGKLSIAQIEGVVYAGQAHFQKLADGSRKGFFIADGTGVGKGREISGVIMDNMRQGRKKAVWLTVNKKLFHDAVRDWTGIGGNKDILFDLGKTKPDKEVARAEGIMFVTYGTMRSGSKFDRLGNPMKQAETKSRIDQIVNWFGKDYDGPIVFDEAHMMGNVAPGKGKRGNKQPSSTGLTGLELQRALPNARVLYVSATGATEVNNLAYAERLGLWGSDASFPTREVFVNEIQSGGLGAMEIVSRDLKALGSYISRNLSYEDVQYDTLKHEIDSVQHKIYNRLADAWQVTLKNLNEALELTGIMGPNNKGQVVTKNSDAKGAARAKFWGVNQRFFNQILTSMQMPSVITDIERQLKDGKSVVLQLVNTNEATQKRKLAEIEEETELEDLDMTPRDALIEYLKNAFPVQQFEEYKEDDKIKSRPVFDSQGNPVLNKQAVAKREALIADLMDIKVPQGPLEMILDHFGTDKVAEVTGRTQRVVWKTDEQGKKHKAVESWSESKSLKDADLFQTGKKRMLVFSYAGGTGASFHADLTAKNQEQRVHYLLQAGWEATRAVQGFGRTHRTNQASAPIYKLVTTNLNGQKRFISSIARKLDQLGALTKGQRQAGSQGMFAATDNLENKYAHDALYRLLVDLKTGQTPGLEWGATTEQLGFDRLLDEAGNLNVQSLPAVPQFLNRILSVSIELQNSVFDAFHERLVQNIERAIADGTYDVGMEDYRADGIKTLSEQTVYTHPSAGTETKIVEMEARYKNKKFTYEDITGKLKTAKDKNAKSIAGFYRNKKSGKVWAAWEAGTHTNPKTGEVLQMYQVQGATAHNHRYLNENEFTFGDKQWQKFESVSDAKEYWTQLYKEAPEFRTEKPHLITGVLLPIWDRLPDFNTKVYRVRTDEGKKYIGRYIPQAMVNQVKKALGAKAGEIKPKNVMESLQSGATVRLANGWRIEQVKVSGENRIEIMGNLWGFDEELKAAGAFMERVDYKQRWFIPTGTDGEKVIEDITKYKPITEISTGEDESPALSRKLSGEELQALQKEALKVEVGNLTKNWNNAPKIKVVQSESELPESLQRYIESSTGSGDIEGIFDPKTKSVYLVADNINSLKRAQTVIFHEAIGHYGLRGLLGDDVKPILTQVYFSKKAEAQKIAEQYGIDIKTKDGKWQAAEEVLARMAGRNEQSRFLDKVYAAIKNFLRKIGFDIKLSDNDLRVMVSQARQFVETGEKPLSLSGITMRESVLYEGQPMFSKDISPVSSDFEEVEQRFKAAKGMPQTSFTEKMKARAEKTLHSFTRHFPHLDPKTDGAEIDILRNAENIPEFSKKKAAKDIAEIAGNLRPNQAEVFTRNLILEDMLKDIDSGLLQGELPFGYKDESQVRRDHEKFRIAVQSDPAIRAALDKRNTYMTDLKERLVDAGLLKEAVLEDDRYFHHQVLEYMALKAMGGQYPGVSSGDMRLHKKGWQIARQGSALDFNTDYLQSEFEVVSQGISQLEMKDSLNRLRAQTDKTAELKAQAKEEGVDLKDVMPEGYVRWQPERGNIFYKVYSLTENTLDKLLADIDTWDANKDFKELMESNEVKEALALGTKKEEWVIPARLAETLDNFRKIKEEGPVGKASKAILNTWKQWTLLNPFRIVKYNINNLSGDMDIALAYNSKILKYAKQAARDLLTDQKRKELSPTLKAELEDAMRKGVISSGLTITEIPDISETGLFSVLTGKDRNLIQKVWKTAKDYTNWRENILRLAAYRHFKAELAKGKRLYGASKQSEIDAVRNLDDRAAKLARELIGDYGNISESGQWIRAHMIPFYSWMEINAPRYVRLFKNLRHEGENTKALSGVMAWKASKLGLKASMLYALIMLWNATFFPDEDDEMGRLGRKQLHLILGRNEDGSIRSLRFQGALSDALSWFGLENLPQDYTDIMKGKVSWSKKFEEMYKAPLQRIVQSARPFEKTGYEIATGKAMYPDMFKPRPIRDKAEHAFRVLSVDMPYRFFAGKPSKGLGAEAEGFLTFRTDPKEAAYYATLNNIREFLKEQNYEVPDITPTKKSNALYYYKQAKKYGDKDAQDKYLKEYIALGGRKQDIYKSVRKSDPMAFLPLKYRGKFMRSLDAEDRETFTKARQWWRETYLSH